MAKMKRSEWLNSPVGRLTADGGSKAEHIRRRARWLVNEWQLPRCPKIGRTWSKELTQWCENHDVSFDWLLYGDLKGLQRMMQARRMGKAAAG
ncbi:hypothetical protein [Bradyrhizobium sp. UFLA05-112]